MVLYSVWREEAWILSSDPAALAIWWSLKLGSHWITMFCFTTTVTTVLWSKHVK